jgi:protein-disulfide isomerase-like protein with CxxC motif
MGPTSPHTYLEAAKATQAYLDADRREVYDESAATQRVLEQLLAQARRNLQTLEAVERAHRRTRPLKR